VLPGSSSEIPGGLVGSKEHPVSPERRIGEITTAETCTFYSLSQQHHSFFLLSLRQCQETCRHRYMDVFKVSSTISHARLWNVFANQMTHLGCPDGSIGRVTQIQEERAEPFQPAIYITDCSPSWRNVTSHHESPPSGEYNGRIMKRQEQICPADCSNSCSGGTKPSSSDCANLVNYLNSRGGPP
jgi:hypothetical protein